jgi:hypothetical protein
MRICLRRRDFIATLGGAAAWPLAARGQQSVKPVIGYLSSRTAESAIMAGIGNGKRTLAPSPVCRAPGGRGKARQRPLSSEGADEISSP